MLQLKRILSLGNRCSYVANRLRLKSTSVLLNRSLVKVSGEETLPFLQGLITNDTRHLTENGGTSVTLPCIYTLLLNLQGRVLYDALLYNAPGSNGKEVWLECDTSISEDVMKLLKKYRVRKKIDISLANDLSVWATTDSQFKVQSLIFVNDPRLQHRESHSDDSSSTSLTYSLGFRAITDKNTHFTSEDSLNYKQRRYELGIGEGVEDHPPGNCFPLEINGDYLHGVSFFKGCYVGQELTSRTHHLGVVRKRYMPVNLNTSPTSDIPRGTIIENETGKNVGKFLNSTGTNGLALLRIEEVLKSKELKLKGHGLTLTTTVPEWWPKKEASKPS